VYLGVPHAFYKIFTYLSKKIYIHFLLRKKTLRIYTLKKKLGLAGTPPRANQVAGDSQVAGALEEEAVIV
jgi:hypothetical protein